MNNLTFSVHMWLFIYLYLLLLSQLLKTQKKWGSYTWVTPLSDENIESFDRQNWVVLKVPRWCILDGALFGPFSLSRTYERNFCQIFLLCRVKRKGIAITTLPLSNDFSTKKLCSQERGQKELSNSKTLELCKSDVPAFGSGLERLELSHIIVHISYYAPTVDVTAENLNRLRSKATDP